MKIRRSVFGGVEMSAPFFYFNDYDDEGMKATMTHMHIIIDNYVWYYSASGAFPFVLPNTIISFFSFSLLHNNAGWRFPSFFPIFHCICLTTFKSNFEYNDSRFRNCSCGPRNWAFERSPVHLLRLFRMIKISEESGGRYGLHWGNVTFETQNVIFSIRSLVKFKREIENVWKNIRMLSGLISRFTTVIKREHPTCNWDWSGVIYILVILIVYAGGSPDCPDCLDDVMGGKFVKCAFCCPWVGDKEFIGSANIYPRRNWIGRVRRSGRVGRTKEIWGANPPIAALRSAMPENERDKGRWRMVKSLEEDRRLPLRRYASRLHTIDATVPVWKGRNPSVFRRWHCGQVQISFLSFDMN